MAKMVYPYTIGAMVKAFPIKYHVQKSWVFKAYALGLVLATPFFISVTNAFPAENNLWGNPITFNNKKDH